MDRVTKSILGYLAVIAAGVVLVFGAIPLPFNWRHGVVVSACLVPGRIQGILWREFFRGRHAMTEKRVVDALSHFLRFEERLSASPGLRHAIYLQWSIYTWNAHAMLNSNIGACELALGRVDAAESRLERAKALDPGCPLPYFNLAVLAYAKGFKERANQLLGEAHRRGFRGGTRERMISIAGGLLAVVEGRGQTLDANP